MRAALIKILLLQYAIITLNNTKTLCPICFAGCILSNSNADLTKCILSSQTFQATQPHSLIRVHCLDCLTLQIYLKCRSDIVILTTLPEEEEEGGGHAICQHISINTGRWI